MALTEYTWVLVLSIIFAFLGAFGIGANDVANAFATSVGSEAITIKQAIVIASIFEFSGAFFMGSHVAKTIRKGITDLDLYKDDPALLMFGMFCVLISVACWLAVATFYKLPVSTTHTAVGSVMGMAIVAKGFDALNMKVVGKILLSWIFSPVLSGVAAIIIYKFIVYMILKKENPADRTIKFYPFAVGFTIMVIVFYTIYKGTPALGLKNTPIEVAIGAALGCAFVFGLITHFLIVPWLLERMEAQTQADIEEEMESTVGVVELQKGGEFTDIDFEENDASEKRTPARSKSFVDKVIPDVKEKFQADASPELVKMLENAEVYDEKSEQLLGYLQVFSACFDAFAHGANDVANSIGPFAAVVAIYNSGEVESKVDVPAWVLAVGAIGIVVGLALYGYNIIQAIGFELTKVTPSRGFSIEMGAALIVITGSRLEIPLSTTHCQVGATVGVGMSQGCSNVNWLLFGKVIGGWIITLVVAACVTGVVFAFAVKSPRLE